MTFYDEQVIHPNGIRYYIGQVTIQRANKTVPLIVRAIWYAENMETRRQDFEIMPNSRPLRL
jgi:hypothetical protein